MSGGAHRGRVGARRCAVQALYQWQLTSQAPDAIYREFVSERELPRVDIGYFEQLVREIPRHFDALLAALTPALDRPWQNIGPVERAVLLVGAYELEHSPHIPRRVVINEAVELARMFGAEEGYRYINAVLDVLSRSMRPAEAAAEGASGG